MGRNDCIFDKLSISSRKMNLDFCITLCKKNLFQMGFRSKYVT